MSVQFFQTVMGRKFYEADVPRIISALERIAKALEKTSEPILHQLADDKFCDLDHLKQYNDGHNACPHCKQILLVRKLRP